MYARPMSIEELCKKLRPIFGKKIDDVYLKYSLTTNKDQKEEIENALRALYQKHVNNSLLNEKVLLEPPKQDIIKGKYPLGKVIYGEKELYQFGLREKDWMRHMCVTGMSGSGKTTFAFQILGNFIFHKKPFLVFDWKKSFRPLMLLNNKIHVFTVGNDTVANFKININKPPAGVDPKEWINLLADLVTDAFGASFGVHKLLVQTLDKAFKEFGIYAQSQNYPTWYQIKDRLEEKAATLNKKSRESEWLESALRITHAMTFGNFGKAICYKGSDANSIQDLLKNQVIMELASLSNTEKKFFCQFILSYIYKYAKAGNVNTTESFKSVILVDEAHNIFLKDKQNFISESISDIIFREIREYGISLITLDQHISKLSDVVSGNSACNIAFQQMLPTDLELISKLMRLEEEKSYFTKLPVGVGIVRLAERHHEPFTIKAPLIKLKSKSITDANLKSRMKELTKSERRKKVFLEECKQDNLTKKLQDLDLIYKKTGIKPDKEYLKKQIQNPHYQEALQAANIAQKQFEDKEEPQKKPTGLVNHLQQKIFDITKQRLDRGDQLKDIKNWFINDGYNKDDIKHTFEYIKKKKIMRKIKKKRLAQGNLGLTEDQKRLIYFALKLKDLPITQIYKHADLSARKGTVVKKELENLNIIEVREDKTDKGWSKHIEVINDDILEQIKSYTPE